jgi:hypothetical protein
MCHHGGCRSGSWEELMGHVTDVCQPTSHDDSGSYDGGDSEVKVTRLATGALCQLPRGNKTQSSTSSKKAARWLTAARQFGLGAGSSRDGRKDSARFNLED